MGSLEVKKKEVKRKSQKTKRRKAKMLGFLSSPRIVLIGFQFVLEEFNTAVSVIIILQNTYFLNDFFIFPGSRKKFLNEGRTLPCTMLAWTEAT